MADGKHLHRDCEECRRLWHEYANATAAHIHLVGKQEVASLQHDYDAVDVLEPKVTAADTARCAAREAIASHEEKHLAQTSAASE